MAVDGRSKENILVHFFLWLHNPITTPATDRPFFHEKAPRYFRPNPQVAIFKRRSRGEIRIENANKCRNLLFFFFCSKQGGRGRVETKPEKQDVAERAPLEECSEVQWRQWLPWREGEQEGSRRRSRGEVSAAWDAFSERARRARRAPWTWASPSPNSLTFGTEGAGRVRAPTSTRVSLSSPSSSSWTHCRDCRGSSHPTTSPHLTSLVRHRFSS